MTESTSGKLKHLHVLSKHLYGRLEIAPIEGVGELLC
jgi:hypothetical protein